MSGPAPPVVTLYRRDGCHLCDEAERLLEPLARQLRFRVEPVDIEADDKLLQRYLFEIPVVALEGRELLKAPIWPARLQEVLEEALAGYSAR